MRDYEVLRQTYKPSQIKVLLIAESPPPNAEVGGSRHFYRADKPRQGDRLFVNTMKAIYPDAALLTEQQLESGKEEWLRRFQTDGFYLIEALEISQKHEVTKEERQRKISQALPSLIGRVKELAMADTKIILIKSNVFEVAASPLREAGFDVLNRGLVDYPGQYNQRTYREKLTTLLKEHHVI